MILTGFNGSGCRVPPPVHTSICKKQVSVRPCIYYNVVGGRADKLYLTAVNCLLLQLLH